MLAALLLKFMAVKCSKVYSQLARPLGSRVQTTQQVCRAEWVSWSEALGRQEGVPCFGATLIIEPTFLHKWSVA